MAVWKTYPTNSNVRNQNAPSPKHPGMQMVDGRDFGLDNSGWGSVNQDADGSGWGKTDQTEAGKGWGSSSAGGSAGW
ncbi:unnamed protein product [Umbelopsis ramanniana]